jgi:hypothetical protein
MTEKVRFDDEIETRMPHKVVPLNEKRVGDKKDLVMWYHVVEAREGLKKDLEKEVFHGLYVEDQELILKVIERWLG